MTCGVWRWAWSLLVLVTLSGVGAAQPSSSPDGTPVTASQFYRELAALRSILEQAMQAQLEHLQALQDEKFRSIELRFTAGRSALEHAVQTSEKAQGEKMALQALAMAKSEAALVDQLKGMMQDVHERERLFASQLVDLKERLDRMEGKSSGISSGGAALLGLVGALVSVVSLVMALRRSQRP